MTDPMQQAVEVLARALWLAEEGHAVNYPADATPVTAIGLMSQAVQLELIEKRATALLAEIAPLIRADEREQCAKVAERRRYSCNTGSPMLDMANAGRTEEASEIAAAIRQRGNE